MPRPTSTPIGLRLATTAKAVSRAFDDALGQAGGTLPTWLVAIALKRQPGASQQQIAGFVGIRGATLSHHLDAMEREGLVSRRRDPANRRTHIVELTDAGEAAFHRMRAAAGSFDRRLRRGFSAEEVEQLASLLGRMHANVTTSDRPVQEAVR